MKYQKKLNNISIVQFAETQFSNDTPFHLKLQAMLTVVETLHAKFLLLSDPKPSGHCLHLSIFQAVWEVINTQFKYRNHNRIQHLLQISLFNCSWIKTNMVQVCKQECQIAYHYIAPSKNCKKSNILENSNENRLWNRLLTLLSVQ